MTAEEHLLARALQVQLDALIDGWQKARLAALSSPDEGMDMAYNEGYAAALDRCIQALRMLRDG